MFATGCAAARSGVRIDIGTGGGPDQAWSRLTGEGGRDRWSRPPSVPVAPLQLQPVVAPQVWHLRQAPLRTMVRWPHSGQGSPV